jgi:hypothetical protein
MAERERTLLKLGTSHSSPALHRIQRVGWEWGRNLEFVQYVCPGFVELGRRLMSVIGTSLT